MNGPERVFTRVRRSFGMHTWQELDNLVSAGDGWAARCVRYNCLTDAALIRIHDETAIPILDLLDLRDCRVEIEPMPMLRYSRKYRRDQRRVKVIVYAPKPEETPDQRQRFEDWARVEGRYTRRDGDSYFDPVLAICWKAWQAAVG